MQYNPQLEGLVNQARAISCQELADREGWQMKRSGHNMAGPCPKCGGTDRFAINTAEDKWHCRNCGVGGNDAISLVMLLFPLKTAKTGGAFIEACEILTGRKRGDVISAEEAAKQKAAVEAKRKRQEEESERRRMEARKAAARIWQRAEPAGEHVEAYLGIRGLLPRGHEQIDELRQHGAIAEIPCLDFMHDVSPKGDRRPDWQSLHRGPAMIACIQWLGEGKTFGGVHQTWLDPNGKKGKAVIVHDGEALDVKKVRGSLGNGAIRLITPEGARRMVVGEGIETTLTPWAHDFRPDTAYWCAVSLGHMSGRAGRDYATGKRLPDIPDLNDVKCFTLPDWVEELVLLGDGDSDEKKTRQALTRAARRVLRSRPGVTVKIAWPGIHGDFNDLAMIKDENDGGLR